VSGHQREQPGTGHVERPAGSQQALGTELRQLDHPLAHAQFRVVDLLQDPVLGQELGEDRVDHVQHLRPDIAGKLGGAEQRVGIAQHLHLLDGMRSAVDEAADQPGPGGHVVQRFQHQPGLALGHGRLGQRLDVVDLARRLSHQGHQPGHRLLQAGQPSLLLGAGMARGQRLGHFRPAFHSLVGDQPLKQRHEGGRLGVARRSLGIVELDLDMEQGRLPRLGQAAGIEQVGESAQVVGQRGQQGRGLIPLDDVEQPAQPQAGVGIGAEQLADGPVGDEQVGDQPVQHTAGIVVQRLVKPVGQPGQLARPVPGAQQFGAGGMDEREARSTRLASRPVSRLMGGFAEALDQRAECLAGLVVALVAAARVTGADGQFVHPLVQGIAGRGSVASGQPGMAARCRRDSAFHQGNDRQQLVGLFRAMQHFADQQHLLVQIVGQQPTNRQPARQRVEILERFTERRIDPVGDPDLGQRHRGLHDLRHHDADAAAVVALDLLGDSDARSGRLKHQPVGCALRLILIVQQVLQHPLVVTVDQNLIGRLFFAQHDRTGRTEQPAADGIP
jgi:hypothetical protein